MTCHEGVGKFVQIIAAPLVEPICCAYNRTGIRDPAADDNLGALRKGFGNAQTAQVCLRIYGIEIPG